MKNKILWLITYIMVALFIVACASFDSWNLLVPALLVVISGAWIYLFAKVNKKKWEV